MGTRFACEDCGSTPASPLLGTRIHLPDPASFVGREGLVMGGQGKRQQEEPVFSSATQAAAPPPGPRLLTLGQEAVSILFGVFNLITEV